MNRTTTRALTAFAWLFAGAAHATPADTPQRVPALPATQASAAAPTLPGNPELAALFKGDQDDRTATGYTMDGAEVARRDEARRQRVMALLAAGEVRSAEDHYHAAMVFQHGSTVEDARLAHALATIAHRMKPDSRGGRWLVASSWDRLMMRMGQPQWYGTQFSKDKSTGRWVLYRIDESLATDEQRADWAVPPLAAAKRRAEDMNGGKPD